jgi:hypothetical protein
MKPPAPATTTRSFLDIEEPPTRRDGVIPCSTTCHSDARTVWTSTTLDRSSPAWRSRQVAQRRGNHRARSRVAAHQGRRRKGGGASPRTHSTSREPAKCIGPGGPGPRCRWSIRCPRSPPPSRPRTVVCSERLELRSHGGRGGVVGGDRHADATWPRSLAPVHWDGRPGFTASPSRSASARGPPSVTSAS